MKLLHIFQGFENLFGKLKNLFLTPKHKHGRTMRSMTTRQISTSNILRQYYPHHDSDIYDILPSTSLATSKTITLPFTYYNETKIRPSKTNFEQISAWLNHNEARSSGCEPSLSLSSLELDRQGKKTNFFFFLCFFFFLQFKTFI